MAVFYLTKDWNIEGFIIGNDVPMHSAIYLIKNQLGVKYFLNRIDTKEPVSISSETDIINSYNRNKSKYINNQPPDLNNPVFYRDWEQINK